MTLMRTLKILSFGLIAAVAIRYAIISSRAFMQSRLTAEACNFVGRSLETGVLSETYDGLLSSLQRSGEAEACVSVVDNGRSYSPDCIKAGVSYHTEICKAEANTGVRAAISFEQSGLMSRSLVLLWVLLSFLVFVGLQLSNLCVSFLTTAFSNEVQSLLHNEALTTNRKAKWTAWLMNRTGMAASLAKQAQVFRSQLTEYDLRAKTELVVRQRLEQEAALSQEFAERVRQVRHDIRSPLTSLQAVYERLKDDDKSKKVLASAIRRTQLLIENMDHVEKKAEAAKLVIAEVVASETINMLAAKFRQAKSGTLSLEYDQKELSPIHVAPEGIRSAIENLLENALDAISVGGYVKLKIFRERGFCKITVEDNGSGISPENLEKIFSSGGTFGKLNGLGLGLYQTKRDIESWSGTIECKSLVQGTCFEMLFPLMQTGVVFVGLPPKGSIKVIDDDAIVPKALKNAGYEIAEFAQSFEEGRKLLAKGANDGVSILVDYRLGSEKFGTELIAEQSIRRQVFLCSNDYDSLELVKKAKEIGVKILPKSLCFFAEPSSLEAKVDVYQTGLA